VGKSNNANGELITVLSTFPEAALQRVVDEVTGVTVINIPEQGELSEEIQGDVLLTPPWDTGNLASVLDRGVSWVHTIGTGVDRMPLDLLADLRVTCARGASALPIAEWTLAVMLAYEKQLPESWINGPPDHWSATQLGSLHGKTLGLIGFGGIGSALAQHALNFGMKVCAFRKTDKPISMVGVEAVRELTKLMGVSDHLVLALPLTRDSHHIINQQTLAAIPPGAGVHLVNPSRGSLVDHDALLDALNDGRVSRASLDTVEPEPLPAGHWLYSHPQVMLSPHISWSMPQAFDLLLDTFIDNLKAYRAGGELKGIVDKKQGY
jgi:phosphoglycerate dehydrogenase-like enzyme